MIKEKAMELVATLRSGEYQQATGRLKTSTGYCCLGVACVLAGCEFTQNTFGDFITEDHAGCVPPQRVRKLFGFLDPNGSRRDCGDLVINGSRYTCLTEANDGGATFAQIADYIEANWEAL